MKKCKNDVFELDIYVIYEEPLFKAIDIAKILDIQNILQNLRNIDNDWKIAKKYTQRVAYKVIIL